MNCGWIAFPSDVRFNCLPAHVPVCLQTSLGWAWTDRVSFEAFAAEAAAAPAGLRSALTQLCLLYGLSRLEAGAEDYLAAGWHLLTDAAFC
jgi:hypothetical protein